MTASAAASTLTPALGLAILLAPNPYILQHSALPAGWASGVSLTSLDFPEDLKKKAVAAAALGDLAYDSHYATPGGYWTLQVNNQRLEQWVVAQTPITSAEARHLLPNGRSEFTFRASNSKDPTRREIIIFSEDDVSAILGENWQDKIGSAALVETKWRDWLPSSPALLGDERVFQAGESRRFAMDASILRTIIGLDRTVAPSGPFVQPTSHQSASPSTQLSPAQAQTVVDWLAENRLILTDVRVERITRELDRPLGGNARAMLQPYTRQGSSRDYVVFDLDALQARAAAKGPSLSLEQLRPVFRAAQSRLQVRQSRVSMGVDALNDLAGCSFTERDWAEALPGCASIERGNVGLINIHVPTLEKLVKGLEADSKPAVALSVEEARLLKKSKDPRISTLPAPGKKEFTGPCLVKLLGDDWRKKLAGLFVDTNNPLPPNEAVYELNMERISEIATGRGGARRASASDENSRWH